MLPFDLHVLGMPPAFNLSQDQTLQFNLYASLKLTTLLLCTSSHSNSLERPHSLSSLLLNELRPEGVLRILLIWRSMSNTFYIYL